MSDSPNGVPPDLLSALAAEAPKLAPLALASANGQANDKYTSRLLVERWLTDSGVEYTKKPTPDGLGRTHYVLKVCPFNPAHGDPDSCIMQAADGQMSAKCFHNSCAGNGWQEFKKAIGSPKREHYDPPLPDKRRKKQPGGPPSGSPESGGDEECQDGLPTIRVGQKQLRHTTDAALVSLLAQNYPPRIFQRGNLLNRIRYRSENGQPYLELLDPSALRGVLARTANWIEVKQTKDAVWDEPVPPPMDVVKDLASLPEWPGVPLIEAVVECPVYDRQGQLVITPGYNEQARVWYQPPAGLTVPEVSMQPGDGEIDLARETLVGELLGDFPFVDAAGKAHAVAAIILPFVRAMIDGPTPLHLIDAPTEGTGKTLLATNISIPATGRDAEPLSEAGSDEEWRKRITAALIEAPAFLLLDNLNRTLDSAALASVLTTRMWKDRVLGVSKTVTSPNNAVWLASGNNTQLSRELIRRTVWCRLDSRTDVPWERKGFRHPNLIGWAKEHRGELIWAALTLCQAWLASGRPKGKQVLGMYESWAETIGGILDVAGIPGLLANAEEFRKARADKQSEWRAFVQCWWATHNSEKVGAKELFVLVRRESLLCSVVGDGGDRSQQSKLGRALAKAADRIYAGFLIKREKEEDHSGCQQYHLELIAKPEPASKEAEMTATEREITALFADFPQT